MGCWAHGICAPAAGLAGLPAMMVAPLRASVTDAAVADAESTSEGRVGLAFSQAVVVTRRANALQTVKNLSFMCVLLEKISIKRQAGGAFCQQT